MDIIKHNMAELVLALNHNYREEKTTNTAFKADNDYLMLGCKDFKELQQRAFNIIAEREDAYTQRTGQKVQAKTAKAVEIILEINEDTTAQDIMDSYGEYFKNNFGVEILGIAIHRDEGYLIGKEPPYRRLTSGTEFELDQKTGKYYELKSNGKTYERGKELDISNFNEYKNLHAQILISNLRADGSSITKLCEEDNKKFKELEKIANSKGEKLNIKKAIENYAFKPTYKTFDKDFFKDFSNNWHKIYNEKFPNKTPLQKAVKSSDEPKTSVFEPMLEKIADKIIQGTRNKQKLNDSLGQQLEQLKQYVKDNENPIKRIKSYKHFLPRLNKLADTNEALNHRDYRTFLSQMRESGANVRLQQILLQKLSQMSEQELKEPNQNSDGKGKFFGFWENLIHPKEKQQPQEPKAENNELKAENDKLKAENQELKAENNELKDNLENARQEINNILKFFDLPILEKIADFKNSNFLANLKQKIKNAFKRSEVAQKSTNSNLDDKSYTKEQKTLENDENQLELGKITEKYESREQEKKPSNQVLKRK